MSFMVLLGLGVEFDFRPNGATTLDLQRDQSEVPVLKDILSVRNTQAVLRRFHRPFYRGDDAVLVTINKGDFSVHAARRLNHEGLHGFFGRFSDCGWDADAFSKFDDDLKARRIEGAARGSWDSFGEKSEVHWIGFHTGHSGYTIRFAQLSGPSENGVSRLHRKR